MTVKHPNFTGLCSSPTISTSMTMAQDRVTRKWEIFQGRNRFYCGGRFMTAPKAGVFLLTVFLITGTSTVFFIFDCKYLAENVTIAIPIIGVFLFVFTMSSLLRTSLSDPGIIPRATSEEAAYVEKQIEVTNSANSPTYRPPPRTKEVLVKGQTIKLKYCFTCKLFRPPRASHCSICDNCVDRFDHHCPWVGNCVGRRNYRFFYMFIVSLAFLAVFIFACAVAHLILITRDGKFFEAVKESPASAVVAVICFFSVWSILGLAGFHTYLTTSNQTTNEDIKGSFTSKRGQDSFNPYSQGNVCLNCFHILCGPIAPSLIDRRGIVTNSYRSELSQPITLEPNMPLGNYGLKAQTGPVHITTNTADLSGIYRQATESTGMYSPLRRHIYLAQQIIPSKNCANPKIIPSRAPLVPPYNMHQRPTMVQGTNMIKNSNSMPQLKGICLEDYYEYELSQYYNPYDSKIVVYHKPHRQPPPPNVDEDQFSRPYTPQEKRYNSSTFGYKEMETRRVRDKPGKQQPRPRSSCVYENVHVTSEDIIDTYRNVKPVRFDGKPHVRIESCPYFAIAESNAGSVTHLVSSEHPLAIAPALQRLPEDFSSHYKSHPSLDQSPVYNNILPGNSHQLSKSHSYGENINSIVAGTCNSIERPANRKINMAEDLCLDQVVVRDNHILDRIKYADLKLDNDRTVPDKENSLMSASRLRLLQDTTMIESALDLDSLEESSVGANSQADLMKVMV
ncbi:hypothetical protein HUJ05_003887 [Dendroctonus ponderosae]|nr:hypothetical protein HUJ05_003887 [Dendroctonus ponderosae]